MASSGEEAEEGEIAVLLENAPIGVMPGYLDEPDRTRSAMRNDRYHTGDVAVVDSEGYLTYVGRNDDLFKSSDYRISPFELESVLIEHEAVVEAAVVPSPDLKRTSVPKAFVVLASGHAPSRETALSILRFVRERSSPFKRIRRIEFCDLPKTISGKIRRIDLRQQELTRSSAGRREQEYWEEDFHELS
jgi:acetyl-CoA synthetase